MKPQSVCVQVLLGMLQCVELEGRIGRSGGCAHARRPGLAALVRVCVTALREALPALAVVFLLVVLRLVLLLPVAPLRRLALRLRAGVWAAGGRGGTADPSEFPALFEISSPEPGAGDRAGDSWRVCCVVKCSCCC